MQWLDLSYNQLRELPEAIASLSELQVLYLLNNQLKWLTP
ncbi:leucine-rich repeat domain-containing protein [Microcoleus sp. S36a_D3]